jgi:pimeloyl-ACP methyl ester carboxylesterase
MKILRALWEHRPTSRFPEITVPVMLTPADNGQSEGWAADKRHAIRTAETMLRKARTHWFEPADHDLHAQFPERLAAHLLDALADGFFDGTDQ